MIEQMTYIADDGTVFYDKEECVQYEWKNRIDDMRLGDLLILNCDREPCYFSPEEACYVMARTDEAIEVLREIFDFYDENLPWLSKVWEDPATINSFTMWVRDGADECWSSYIYLTSLREKIVNTCNTIEELMRAN